MKQMCPGEPAQHEWRLQNETYVSTGIKRIWYCTRCRKFECIITKGEEEQKQWLKKKS